MGEIVISVGHRMSYLIDSHCHLNLLNLDKYNGDLGVLIQAAKDANVKKMLCIGIDLVSAQTVIDIAQRFENVYASVGVHPSEKLEFEPTIEILRSFASQNKVVAIGETGLDYYYNDSGFDLMQQRFRNHIRLARELKKPLIIHTRDAREDTIRILREENAQEVRGVMHCFTEDWTMAERAIELGFYISISGIVTFKNAKNVQDVAARLPLSNLLIETDAPYLTPDPFRGKPNEPQYVTYVAKKIAELKNVSVEEVVAATTRNCLNLFKMD